MPLVLSVINCYLCHRFFSSRSRKVSWPANINEIRVIISKRKAATGTTDSSTVSRLHLLSHNMGQSWRPRSGIFVLPGINKVFVFVFYSQFVCVCVWCISRIILIDTDLTGNNEISLPFCLFDNLQVTTSFLWLERANVLMLSSQPYPFLTTPLSLTSWSSCQDCWGFYRAQLQFCFVFCFHTEAHSRASLSASGKNLLHSDQITTSD